jgi:hypothetical protein
MAVQNAKMKRLFIQILQSVGLLVSIGAILVCVLGFAHVFPLSNINHAALQLLFPQNGQSGLGVQ